MESVAGIPGVDEILDQFGQTPQSIRLYTQLCFCFSLTDTSPLSQSEVIGLLKTGLERLSVSFRWIAGQVVYDDGVFRIRPFEKTPILVVRDLRNDLPTMDEFQDAEFPFSMLDERVLSQCNTFEADLKKPAPVLALQANFITGGLLLVFSGWHKAHKIYN
jgi:hypothetical protein